MSDDKFGIGNITIEQIAEEEGFSEIEKELLEVCGLDFSFDNLDVLKDFFLDFSEEEVIKAIIDIRELGADPHDHFARAPLFEVHLDHIEISPPLDAVDEKLEAEGYSSAKIGDHYFMYSVDERPSPTPL